MNNNTMIPSEVVDKIRKVSITIYPVIEGMTVEEVELCFERILIYIKSGVPIKFPNPHP